MLLTKEGAYLCTDKSSFPSGNHYVGTYKWDGEVLEVSERYQRIKDGTVDDLFPPGNPHVWKAKLNHKLEGYLLGGSNVEVKLTPFSR